MKLFTRYMGIGLLCLMMTSPSWADVRKRDVFMAGSAVVFSSATIYLIIKALGPKQPAYQHPVNPSSTTDLRMPLRMQPFFLDPTKAPAHAPIR